MEVIQYYEKLNYTWQHIFYTIIKNFGNKK